MKKKWVLYLHKILNKEAFDHSGLIYGMGHAVYTLSDPREVILKRFAKALAEEKGRMKEFALYELVESLAGKMIKEQRNLQKNVCANVDFLQWICVFYAWYSTRTLYANSLQLPECQDGAHTDWKS